MVWQGGLYPQMVCQIEGPNGVIECGGAIVGSTGGVGQGARVDSGLWSIIVDVGGKSGLLGRSISTHTTIGRVLKSSP